MVGMFGGDYSGGEYLVVSTQGVSTEGVSTRGVEYPRGLVLTSSPSTTGTW